MADGTFSEDSRFLRISDKDFGQYGFKWGYTMISHEDGSFTLTPDEVTEVALWIGGWRSLILNFCRDVKSPSIAAFEAYHEATKDVTPAPGDSHNDPLVINAQQAGVLKALLAVSNMTFEEIEAQAARPPQPEGPVSDWLMSKVVAAVINCQEGDAEVPDDELGAPSVH